MAAVIAKKNRLSRRALLKGCTLSQASIVIGLPPLVSMFNSHGTAYAAGQGAGTRKESAIESRFVFWYNGNGIPERYWIPAETGPDFDLTPCLNPLARLRT